MARNEVDSAAFKRMKRIDTFFWKKYKKKRFNGTVLFADKGEIVFKGAYGKPDFSKEDTLTTHSSFQLASVSKPLTALAVLKLVESGKIALKDSVQKFIPDFPYPGITIELLLIHRHGLSNYMYFCDKYWADWELPMSNQDVIDIMIEEQPAVYYRPNRRYNYSNTGYMLLATIIEKASGISFEEYMQKEIFDVAQMTDSFINNESKDPDLKKKGAVGYRPNGKRAPGTYQNGVVGDKGVYSSVEDLFKLDQALYDERIISQEMQDSAFTKAHKELYDYDNYGFGWRIKDYKDYKVIYHSGWWKGFKTNYIRVLPQEWTIIVLTNKLNNHLNVNRLVSLMQKSSEVKEMNDFW